MKMEATRACCGRATHMGFGVPTKGHRSLWAGSGIANVKYDKLNISVVPRPSKRLNCTLQLYRVLVYLCFVCGIDILVDNFFRMLFME